MRSRSGMNRRSTPLKLFQFGSLFGNDCAGSLRLNPNANSFNVDGLRMLVWRNEITVLLLCSPTELERPGIGSI